MTAFITYQQLDYQRLVPMKFSSSAFKVNAVVVQRQVGRVDGVVVVGLEIRLLVGAVPGTK